MTKCVKLRTVHDAVKDFLDAFIDLSKAEERNHLEGNSQSVNKFILIKTEDKIYFNYFFS